MSEIISTGKIEETKTFQKLEQFQKKLVVKRENRKILETGYIHFTQYGEYPSFLSSNNVKLLKDIIENEQPKPTTD